MDETNAIEPDYIDEERPEVRGPWQVTTLADADWALHRLGECQAELDDVDEMETGAIARIKERTETLRCRIARGIAFFEGRLLHWMEANRSELLRGKAKSKALVNGRVGWRGYAERIVIRDKAALEEWLRAQPEGSPLVRIKYEPVMAEIQKHLQTQGEIPPGCDVEPAGEEPYAKPEPITSSIRRK